MWRSKAKIMVTEMGPVEYYLEGDKGPVMAAFHGMPGNCFQSEYILCGFKDRKCRRLAWSRPGYSGTPLKTGRKLQEQADVFALLLDSLKIDKVFAMAFSFGAPVASDFASRYPERVMAVIFDSPVAYNNIDKTGFLVSSIIFSILFSNIGSMILYLTSKAFRRFAIQTLIHMQSSYSRKRVKEIAKKMSNDVFMSDLIYNYIIKALHPFRRHLPGFKNDRDIAFNQLNDLEFGKIKVPVLIIHGTDDLEVPVSHGFFLSRHISGAEFCQVSGASHLTLLTDREELTRKKLEFIGRFYPRIFEEPARTMQPGSLQG